MKKMAKLCLLTVAFHLLAFSDQGRACQYDYQCGASAKCLKPPGSFSLKGRCSTPGWASANDHLKKTSPVWAFPDPSTPPSSYSTCNQNHDCPLGLKCTKTTGFGQGKCTR